MDTTYQNLQDIVASRVNGNLTDAKWLIAINGAARAVLLDVDLRGTKRKSSSSPFLFDDVFSYTCPADLKGTGLIDIKPQIIERGPKSLF